MGMYTDLQVKGVLNDIYVDEIKRLMGCRLSGQDFWASSEIKELRSFGENDTRADFIPMGACVYHDELEEDISDGTKLSLIQKDDKYIWEFVCTLKNYDDTIGTWINDIATRLFRHATLYTWYEETRHPTKWTISRGVLTDHGLDKSMGYSVPEYGPYGLPL